MTPNPILKVLSTLTWHRVEHLLMGGQACVLYGGAEFSRDTDVAILAAPENLARLESALADLQAHCIAVPPFRLDYLLRGHAVHFRARTFGGPRHADRRDGGDAWSSPFEQLWPRRTTLQIESGEQIELISLTDLVQAKKTQRDKDWSMLRRLIEANHAAHREAPTPQHVEFWLRVEDRDHARGFGTRAPRCGRGPYCRPPVAHVGHLGRRFRFGSYAFGRSAAGGAKPIAPIGSRYAGSWKNCGNTVDRRLLRPTSKPALARRVVARTNPGRFPP